MTITAPISTGTMSSQAADQSRDSVSSSTTADSAIMATR